MVALVYVMNVVVVVDMAVMNVVVVDTAVMDAVDMAVMEEEASLSCNI
jgi:hypothetical protein